jgi:hypothetical protein
MAVTNRDIDMRLSTLECRLQNQLGQEMTALKECLVQSQSIISNPTPDSEEVEAWRAWMYENDQCIAQHVPPGWEFPNRISTKGSLVAW